MSVEYSRRRSCEQIGLFSMHPTKNKEYSYSSELRWSSPLLLNRTVSALPQNSCKLPLGRGESDPRSPNVELSESFVGVVNQVQGLLILQPFTPNTSSSTQRYEKKPHRTKSSSIINVPQTEPSVQ